ncbi:MAG TPA: LacI family DNA-binding transcriptional regulator [Humibacter sp.]|nr:LacI family DNA-binding transcriptional regulator [Humibacter sp.]
MASQVVSVKDVAAHANVSLGTVSNVLNRPEKVSDATRERVQASIERLGFVRNESARHLRAGQSKTIGFVVLDVSNPFFTDVARGAERAAARAASSVLIANSGERGERELAYLDLFEEQRAQGVLISPGGNVTKRLERLRDRGIPTVLVDSPAPRPDFSSVQTNDVAGGRLAVSHLIELGRRRIAFVGGPLALHQIRDRLAGARLAADAAGLPADAVQHWDAQAPTAEEGKRLGFEIAALRKQERPDAVFAANDLLAIGLMQALLLERRVRIPQDIALIGYDDIGWASSAFVPLSSIRQPSELIGETAARLLIEESAGMDAYEHQQLQFTPVLVARDSTGG